MEHKINIIQHIDALEGIKQLPDECVNCIVTSPPYWMLRNYGVSGQLGMEQTPEQYIQVMVEVFRECRRVLAKDGTCWINIGDSYMGSGKAGNNPDYKDEPSRFGGSTTKKHPLIKQKDQVGIPFMLALALRDDGWYLRDTIIWAKPSPMPESVNDRCTKAHEYIFMLTKSKRYYYDAYAISTSYKDKTLTTFGIENKSNNSGDGSGLIASENWANSVKVRKQKEWKTPSYWDTDIGSHGNIHRQGRTKSDKNPMGDTCRDIAKGIDGSKFKGHSGNYDANGDIIGNGRANKRSVWTIGSQPYKDAHFATFPEELPYTCILAGCKPNGIVLDPFMGAGTTALVARKINRNFIGFELKEEYVKMANNRLIKELGMFK